MKKPNILFLADTTHQAGAVLDHIRAVTASHEFNWHIFNPLTMKTLDKLDLSLFDAIGIHFSIKLHGHYYLSRPLKQRIQAYTGPKFVFLQDEYQKVNETQGLLYRLGFDVLFTLVQPDLFERAYPDHRLNKLKKVHILTGYVDEAMCTLKAPPIAERPIDVSYRARRCDYRLGKLGQEKVILASEFMKRVEHSRLTLDISTQESDRIYGQAWFDLLMRSKVVLGTESGASIWDADGEVSKKIQKFLRKNRGASFDTVFEALLKPYEGNLLYRAVSPRVFEAAAAKTAMVMFVGDYSGVCKPNVHYIALEKDFSNLSEVLQKIQDNDYLQAMVDRTHNDLILSGAYACTQLTQVVANELKRLLPQEVINALPSVVLKHHEAILKKYRFLNQLRRISTETRFVIYQFFQLLLIEPSMSWSHRIGILYEGAKRYISYLVPRIKRS